MDLEDNGRKIKDTKKLAMNHKHVNCLKEKKDYFRKAEEERVS